MSAKVYVVATTGYEDYEIYGIYNSLDLAIKAFSGLLMEASDHITIQVYNINEGEVYRLGNTVVSSNTFFHSNMDKVFGQVVKGNDLWVVIYWDREKTKWQLKPSDGVVKLEGLYLHFINGDLFEYNNNLKYKEEI